MKKYKIPKKRYLQTTRGHGSTKDMRKDARIPAKKQGWRESKLTGMWYFENRYNRSDKRNKRKPFL